MIFQSSPRPFLIEGGKVISYGEFAQLAEREADSLRACGMGRGMALVLEAENETIHFARLAACMELGIVVFPCPPYQFRDPAFRKLLPEEMRTSFAFLGLDEEPGRHAKAGSKAIHPLLERESAGGACIFISRTTGSSGKPFKFAAHDFRLFLKKHESAPDSYSCTLAFSPADSIGGMETFSGAITRGSRLALLSGRPDPWSVQRALRENGVDFFQTTPSFLNLMLVSGALADLPSLKRIAFGSEPPLTKTLQEIRRRFPAVELSHTYGMTETGILSTITDQENPGWFKLDEQVNPGKIEGGLLEVKSPCRMLGYLNLEFPLPENGWFPTGDRAEENGRMIRVLGRDDDVINIAGRKFLPAEAENLIASLDAVADAVVLAEPSERFGRILVARIVLADGSSKEEFLESFKKFSEQKIPPHMRPHRVEFCGKIESGGRFKKVRKQAQDRR